MKLEAGKYYRNRKGLIMGPLKPSEAYGSTQFKGLAGGVGPCVYWYANGNHLENHMIHAEDLLFEVLVEADYHATHVAAHADMVNHPPHYQSAKGIECIDAIEAAMTVEEFRGYLRGNCLKYLWRAEKKGGDEDLKKAAWYLNRLTSPAANNRPHSEAS